MILFLYGADTYRSSEKLREIILRYRTIHKNSLSLRSFYCNEKAFEDFKSAVEISAMFNEKKLFILKGFCNSLLFTNAFMAWTNKDMLRDSKETIAVFYQEEVDKKCSAFKWLLENSKSQEFSRLSGQRLIGWTEKYIGQNKIKIDRASLFRLTACAQGDLWRLTNYFQMLKAYKRGDIIKFSDLDTFLSPLVEINIFALIDALAFGDKAKALRLLSNHAKHEGELMQVLALLYRRFRILAQGVRVDKEKIKKMYAKLAQLEIETKIGKLKPREALESFIFEREAQLSLKD